eukprot:m.13552 g.13552  ORF g.13552 m.13552 type:complete len:190 (+) comp4878_c0_seq1:2912-3481(+)
MATTLYSAQGRLFRKRMNLVNFYAETEQRNKVTLPHTAPVPGYTGFYIGMNLEFGNSRAYGLPIELMEIPPTPDPADTNDRNHQLGHQSHYAEMAYKDKEKLLEALRIRRITGNGKLAPFDFVPGDGLVTECKQYENSPYRKFPCTENFRDHARRERHRVQLQKNMLKARKALTETTTPKYSVFKLPAI